jgi:hypothetical protein
MHNSVIDTGKAFITGIITGENFIISISETVEVVVKLWPVSITLTRHDLTGINDTIVHTSLVSLMPDEERSDTKLI